MLPLREWLAEELRVSSRTAEDFFGECWIGCFRTPCRSNTVKLDAKHYNRLGLVPAYVYSTYERLVESLSKITLRGSSENLHGPGFDTAFRIVADSSTLLMARRGKDGVYRC